MKLVYQATTHYRGIIETMHTQPAGMASNPEMYVFDYLVSESMVELYTLQLGEVSVVFMQSYRLINVTNTLPGNIFYFDVKMQMFTIDCLGQLLGKKEGANRMAKCAVL